MLKKLFGKNKGNDLKKDQNTGKVFATQTGKAVDITEVPDEVFAGKMLGEGIAIIPTEGKVYSPVSGEVVSVAPTLHAYGIRTAEGLEYLVHIGLETVAWKGEGFKAAVKQGDQVNTGDLLAEVDLEFIQSKGCKTYTPIVITNLESDKKVKFNLGDVVAKESIVMELV